MRTRGVLARAHNALGQHERARELCLRVLAEAKPEDLEYVVMNLGVPIELAISEAGLGRFQLAHEQLQKLLAQHDPNHSAVTLGSLHEARARVSLMERNFTDAREHLSMAQALYRTLAVASLLGRAHSLAREIERAEHPEAAFAQVDRALDDAQLITVMLRQRAMGRERFLGCLQIALELCGAGEGFLITGGDETRLAAYRGDEPPSPELIAWANHQLVEKESEFETVVTSNRAAQPKWTRKVVGNLHYTAVPLWAERHGTEVAVAALAFGFEDDDSTPPGPRVLRLIAAHLNAAEGA